jgi:Ca2+/Na+ antiporter
VTTACIEALVISDSITDPQKALSELEEKTGNRAVGTTMEPTMTAMSTAMSMASTTLKATVLFTSRGGLDGGTLGAVIGGCIAGVVIIIGVVAFVVFRRRKQSLAGHAPQPQHKTSEYGPIALKSNAKDEYGSSLTNLQ